MVLTSKQYKFLKMLYRGGKDGVPVSEVEKRFPGQASDCDLSDFSFHEFFVHNKKLDTFVLTVSGKREFESRRQTDLRFNFPFFIQIITLIIAVVSAVFGVLNYFR